MKAFLTLTATALFCVMLIFCIGCFYNYFYPLKFQDEIDYAAGQTQVGQALIASIINVESGYNAKARSNKGAIGLMQIMPQTAQYVCQKAGIEGERDLENEGDNILIGANYLKILLSMFGDEDVAICAYNAGPSRVKSWLADSQYSQDGKTLDKIPFEETRQYLTKVKKNMRYYQNKYLKILSKIA